MRCQVFFQNEKPESFKPGEIEFRDPGKRREIIFDGTEEWDDGEFSREEDRESDDAPGCRFSTRAIQAIGLQQSPPVPGTAPIPHGITGRCPGPIALSSIAARSSIRTASSLVRRYGKGSHGAFLHASCEHLNGLINSVVCLHKKITGTPLPCRLPSQLGHRLPEADEHRDGPARMQFSLCDLSAQRLRKTINCPGCRDAGSRQVSRTNVE